MKQQSVSTLVFILVLVLNSVAFGYKFSGNCEVYALNSTTGKYDIPNGSGFLTAKEPNKKFRGLNLNEQYFITSSHQKYNQVVAMDARSTSGAELKNRAACGDITFEYVEIREASKAIRFNFDRQKDASNPKECEVDETSRGYNLSKNSFVWSGCDLSVNRINHNTILGGELSQIMPYSTQVDMPTMDTYKKLIFEVIVDGKKRYIACPIEDHFAGSQIAQCPLNHEYTKNIKTISDVYGIGISSGTVVLAYENNGVAKVNDKPKAVGIVTNFWISNKDITIIIENLKMSADVSLPTKHKVIAQVK